MATQEPGQNCLIEGAKPSKRKNGGSLQTLKMILGHTSLKMTADLYAHVLPHTRKDKKSSIYAVLRHYDNALRNRTEEK